jgi:hypothetical protein
MALTVATSSARPVAMSASAPGQEAAVTDIELRQTVLGNLDGDLLRLRWGG